MAIVLVPGVYYHAHCLGIETGRVRNPAEVSGTINWMSCRETFHGVCRNSPPNKRFFYMFSNERQRLACEKYLGIIQSRLRLGRPERVTVADTSRPLVACFQLSAFWLREERLAFLTAATRIGTTHNPASRGFWNSALNSEYHYFRDTAPAVRHFLSGKTRYVSSHPWQGWVRTFSPTRLPDHRNNKVHRDFIQSALVEDSAS